MSKKIALLSLFLFCPTFFFAAIETHEIPRTALKQFRSEGFFEGGTDSQRANLESLRFFEHSGEGYERWVIDFSDPKVREGRQVAPRFQVRYLKSEKTLASSGEESISKPAKFIFVFRSIQKNFLEREKVKVLLKKSRLVKEIVLYPPIEQGDMAIEFILKQDVLFEPHQPMDNEGRLVLDLKKSS